MYLKGKKIALVIDKNFEDSEAVYPYFRLIEEGAEVIIAGPLKATIINGKWGYPLKSDIAIEELKATDFDGVIVPGGYAPDLLRRYPHLLNFVHEIFNQGKLVASICHGPWVLISAKILSGKRVTCVPAIKDDVINAGASYFDEEVVVDGNLVTSRNPFDLPAFMKAIITFLGKK
ncbi:MAG: putative cysteine protease YraA [candidate division WS2 bacterium]|uniref:Cysteine protease YraA n=1 Tax=Psychracetigena formicireducens TaxID=2986056 RepID=A0A9E2F4K3_PSYF1|nr:putative cysteine protease YraA [Candidatus Psychracetigena formicireducens]MBT9145166.1 putative cysteine protease YraA [Candidatus Psychracetigena formicireducens]